MLFCKTGPRSALDSGMRSVSMMLSSALAEIPRRPQLPPMNPAARRIQRIYLLLLSLHTLAASLIWGINTLFLLDAGLTNTEAFAANAFFTVGMVLFEVPTGVVADTRGRRASYLAGTLTLVVSTALYLLMWRLAAPFWAWALASVLLGLGFTFFSGAVEAWLVDALAASGHFSAGGSSSRCWRAGRSSRGRRCCWAPSPVASLPRPATWGCRISYAR